MKTRIFSLLSVVLMILLVSCSSGRKAAAGGTGAWVRLGERTVDYRVDHDVIDVNYREGTFQQLRFVVRGGALNMYRCTIHFENGSTQDLDLRHNFGKGSTSRIIDLKGNQRFIDRISFWYDTKNFSRRKAVLVVWGK